MPTNFVMFNFRCMKILHQFQCTCNSTGEGPGQNVWKVPPQKTLISLITLKFQAAHQNFFCCLFDYVFYFKFFQVKIVVTIDLLILTCSTPEAAKVDFQTLFCKMLKKKEPYSINYTVLLMKFYIWLNAIQAKLKSIQCWVAVSLNLGREGWGGGVQRCLYTCTCMCFLLY